jgi:hypothetical protein
MTFFLAEHRRGFVGFGPVAEPDLAAGHARRPRDRDRHRADLVGTDLRRVAGAGQAGRHRAQDLLAKLLGSHNPQPD